MHPTIHAGTYLIRDGMESARARFGQFEALTQAYREESFCYRSEGAADIMRILININRSLYNSEHIFAKAQQPSLLSNALHYIDQNLCGDLSLDVVARALYTSQLLESSPGIFSHRLILWFSTQSIIRSLLCASS